MGDIVCFGPDAKSRQSYYLMGGGVLYVLGKAEHRSPTVDTYSVSKGYTYWSIQARIQKLKEGGAEWIAREFFLQPRPLNSIV